MDLMFFCDLDGVILAVRLVANAEHCLPGFVLPQLQSLDTTGRVDRTHTHLDKLSHF